MKASKDTATELGRRIKQLRLAQGLTLKDVEGRVGVSATHVSEIERGKTSPTVGALSRIALALQVNPSFLVDLPVGDDVSLTRRGERNFLVGPDQGERWEILTSEKPHAELSLFVLDLMPNPGKPLQRGPRTGDKFLLVMDGVLQIHLGEERHLLRTGDSIHFKASQAFTLQNPGETPCRVFWASWPRLTL